MIVARTFRSFALFLCLLLAGIATASAAALDATVEPLLDKAALGTGQVRYTLSNPGTSSVLVLRWQTALYGVHEDLFAVSLAGKPVTYVGRHYKRGQPTAADYVELSPGESKSAIVDLTAHYDMRTAGAYEVQALTPLMDAFAENERAFGKLVRLEGAEIKSARTSVWVDGAHVTLEPDMDWLAGPKATSFVGCSNSRQTSVNTAVNSAKTYGNNSSSYLGAGTSGARYTTWFGTYSSSRYSTVRTHFTKIVDALYNKPLVFDCTCTDPYYAYVYPTQPYRVYLCNAFWSAPNTGTDSRAGTIIHELSHFNVVAGTDDHAYGHTAAKKLAQKNPTKAVDNADSHEYFAENTPAQN